MTDAPSLAELRSQSGEGRRLTENCGFMFYTLSIYFYLSITGKTGVITFLLFHTCILFILG